MTLTFDLWPWKSIGFQTLLRTKYISSLVKIHWRMLILVFTKILWGKNLTPWPLTLKINRVPDSPKDYVCTKFGQNPLKDVDPRVFTRMWRTDGSVNISIRNFVDEGITNCKILKCCKILSITWTINVIENHDVIWNFWT